MSKELKPCPFCGGKPEHRTAGKHSIFCKKCGVEMEHYITGTGFYKRFESYGHVKTAWNRRVEPKRGEWINVKERLPEYNPAEPAKAYFVAYDTNKGKQMQIAIYSDYMYATTSELPPCVTWRDYEYHKIKNVTHWMPLPEPPQEDKP